MHVDRSPLEIISEPPRPELRTHDVRTSTSGVTALGRTARTIKPLETIWELSDDLWTIIEPILLDDAPPPPKEHGGRPRIDWRQAINGIIFRLRSGCPWNKLPERFGSD